MIPATPSNGIDVPLGFNERGVMAGSSVFVLSIAANRRLVWRGALAAIAWAPKVVSQYRLKLKKFL
jgi:hypothetical protein